MIEIATVTRNDSTQHSVGSIAIAHSLQSGGARTCRVLTPSVSHRLVQIRQAFSTVNSAYPAATQTAAATASPPHYVPREKSSYGPRIMFLCSSSQRKALPLLVSWRLQAVVPELRSIPASKRHLGRCRAMDPWHNVYPPLKTTSFHLLTRQRSDNAGKEVSRPRGWPHTSSATMSREVSCFNSSISPSLSPPMSWCSPWIECRSLPAPHHPTNYRMPVERHGSGAMAIGAAKWRLKRRKSSRTNNNVQDSHIHMYLHPSFQSCHCALSKWVSPR